MYRDRVVGIKRIGSLISGFNGYIYLCVDYNSRNDAIKNFTNDAMADEIPRNQWGQFTDKMGFFALISSKKIEINDLLPLYFTGHTIEQTFDISKNNIDMLPFMANTKDRHTEETFRVHLMLTFMSYTIYLKLNQLFIGNKILTQKILLLKSEI
ncbi:MAG: hypothetical protein LBF58_09855 [Deltaproteobacteria bacterium]|jgi:hypothetical protein|nr:hypothetical protein [Deltaproteobacteria bacterium]